MAYAFMITAALSPISVYTSMFLPESMFMFFIGLVLIAVLHAIRQYNWQTWAVAGAAIGISSLVKPHAWLSAIAVAITLLVVGLGNRGIGFKKTAVAAGSLLAGAALCRLLIGLLVAGPKALGFFGQYLAFSTLEQVVSGANSSQTETGEFSSPMSGVFALFAVQGNTHLLVISALMGSSVAAITLSLFEIIKKKKLTPETSFSLFTFIWLVSLVIEIVVFTGWVTGSGDDHTSRVLLRYYEFLFVITPLSALVVLWRGIGQQSSAWSRWLLAGVFSGLATPAFTGSFGSLAIQIADAPTLAGLVVNRETFDGVAIAGFIALLTLAAFPRYSSWALLLVLPFSMVGAGWQIQDQYQHFRGSQSSADKAGIFIRESLTEGQLSSTWIIANSRFDATNVAIWADSPHITYELFAPGSVVSNDLVPDGKKYIVAVSEVSMDQSVRVVETNEYFTLYEVTDVMSDKD
jgi:hypothetical protein